MHPKAQALAMISCRELQNGRAAQTLDRDKFDAIAPTGQNKAAFILDFLFAAVIILHGWTALPDSREDIDSDKLQCALNLVVDMFSIRLSLHNMTEQIDPRLADDPRTRCILLAGDTLPLSMWRFIDNKLQFYIKFACA